MEEYFVSANSGCLPRRAVAAFVILMMCCCSVSAAPVFYTDRAAFDAAAGGGLSFESFEGTAQSSATVTYGDLTLSESGGNNIFTHTAISTFFTAATTDGDHSVWYDDNDDSLATLTFGLAAPVTALGMDIAADEDTDLTIGGEISAFLTLTANVPTFFGIIDLVAPFNTVTFAASGGPVVGFDAVSYGTAIPEPASIALLCMISGGICFIRHIFLLV